jgi:hypothetical protein
MTQEKEAFLDRWSRLKREERVKEAAPPPAKQEEAPMPVLPPVEELRPESDFTPFMDARVDSDTRRAALKKLFADAHFNEPDVFEFYSQDFTVSETIPEEMLKSLNHVKHILFDEKKAAQEAQAAAATQEPQPQDQPPEQGDVTGKQDA